MRLVNREKTCFTDFFRLLPISKKILDFIMSKRQKVSFRIPAEKSEAEKDEAPSAKVNDTDDEDS